MANKEQVAALRQGVKIWNKWREEHKDLEIDLSGADLRKMDLSDADLAGANLDGANLNHASLTGANFRHTTLAEADLTNAFSMYANFTWANLSAAHLQGIRLSEANLQGAYLIGTDLRYANLGTVDLRRANLHEANLTKAILIGADLGGADLKASNFGMAECGSTVFGRVDLSEVSQLESVVHRGPSSITTDTLVKSKGQIPEAFLRGCGLSNWEIEMVKLYKPELSNGERNQILYKVYDLQASQAIQISPLFISYSHGDSTFVDKMDKCFTEKGIRYWRDIHDLKAGRMERQIDQAISQDRTVLLVLSEHSLQSDWVEHEVRKAREISKNAGRDTLCPVALDDSWKKSPWPARVMEQIMEYNILDFSEWRDDIKFEGMFRKLIDGLELFYKG